MSTLKAPDRTEAAEYYFTYINQVPDGNVLDILAAQVPEVMALLGDVSEERSTYRYAPEKWSIREVLSHLNDGERLFEHRAFWFARGLDGPLPSFDQNAAIITADADSRSLRSHLEEFRAIRSATLSLFQNLPADAWVRRGVASDNPFSVRALAYIAAGHVTHHLKVLRERYL